MSLCRSGQHNQLNNPIKKVSLVFYPCCKSSYTIGFYLSGFEIVSFLSETSPLLPYAPSSQGDCSPYGGRWGQHCAAYRALYRHIAEEEDEAPGLVLGLCARRSLELTLFARFLAGQ